MAGRTDVDDVKVFLAELYVTNWKHLQHVIDSCSSYHGRAWRQKKLNFWPLMGVVQIQCIPLCSDNPNFEKYYLHVFYWELIGYL